MKKKTDIKEITEAFNAMTKLIKVAKCYNCIHRYEAKLKKTFSKGSILINQFPGERILPKESLKQLEKKIKNALYDGDI